MSTMTITLERENRYIPDALFYTTVELPAERHELEDAIDRARFDSNGLGSITINDCALLPSLVNTRIQSPTIDEMNFLARRLESLSNEQLTALRAVFAQQDFGDDGVTMQELINLTYGLNTVPVWSVDTDEQYGEVVIENEMLDELSDVPDEAISFLDRAKIGEAMRIAEGGVYIDGQYVVPSMYEPQTIYDGVTLPEQPEGNAVFRIRFNANDGTEPMWFNLPCDPQAIDGLDPEMFDDYESSFPPITPDFLADSFDAARLNELARAISELSGDERVKLKAVFSANQPESIDNVFDTIRGLSQYQLDRSSADIEDFGKRYLAAHLPEDFDARLLDKAVTFGLGQAVLDRLGASVTDYGVISAKGGSLTELFSMDDTVAQVDDVPNEDEAPEVGEIEDDLQENEQPDFDAVEDEQYEEESPNIDEADESDMLYL